MRIKVVPLEGLQMLNCLCRLILVFYQKGLEEGKINPFQAYHKR